MNNALANLLKRVAIRVMRNNPTNEVMLETADRVVLWRNAEYITDAEVGEIAAALPGEQSADDAQDGEGEAEAPDAQAVVDALGSRPSKAELLEAAETLGVEVPEGATNPEIHALLESAAGQGA